MADPRFKGIEFKVGLFIILAVVLVFVILVGMAMQKNILTPKTEIKIFADNGEGLKKGMPVLFSGFQVARVEEIRLQDNGRVLLRTQIPKDYTKWIRKDSKVKLSSQGIIGSPSLIFYGGGGEPVKKGDSFHLIRDRGIEELVDKARVMVGSLQDILNNVDKITTRLASDDGNFSKAMKALGELGEDISKKRGIGYLARTDYLKLKIDKLFEDIDLIRSDIDSLINESGSLLSKVNERVSETKQTLNLVNDVLKASDRLVLNIDERLRRIDPVITNANEISSDIAEVTDNLTLMKNEADFMLNTGNRMLLNLETKWPFAANEEGVEKLELP